MEYTRDSLIGFLIGFWVGGIIVAVMFNWIRPYKPNPLPLQKRQIEDEIRRELESKHGSE